MYILTTFLVFLVKLMCFYKPCWLVVINVHVCGVLICTLNKVLMTCDTLINKYLLFLSDSNFKQCRKNKFLLRKRLHCFCWVLCVSFFVLFCFVLFFFHGKYL